MASKSLISWGVGLLLAATLGCNSGTATQSCPSGTTFCNGQCTSTSVDPGNCGACGKVCSGTDNLCQQGACVSSCSGGQTKCGNSCVDTKTDKNNCNSCGTVCSSNQSCNNGACVNNSTTGVGGATGQGGGNTQNGGSGQGGANTSAGGAATGGAVQQGGSNQGGAATGGAQSQGGSNQGGAATGGAQNRGGSSSGGAATGGATTTNAGGATSVGGTTSAGGTTTSAGGTTSTGARPAGYWMSSDWSYPAPAPTYDFHGCAWTGKDSTVTGSTTTVTPTDFTGQASSAPYHVSGKVTADPKYNGVALLGFNLAQPSAGTSCVYDPAAASTAGPPGVAPPSGLTGIAVNFAKTGAFTLRVQIQGPNGATDANDRWCYTITDAAGPIFAPFNKFYTACWFVGDTDATTSEGTAYSGQPISAVVFTVPGNTAELSYDFTINGWAMGTKAGDAPTGGAVTSLSGTIGGAGVTDLDFQRVKVKADGHSYIIQNNNWGNPSSTNQTISYKDNSFTITSPTGNGDSSGAPASFPSIYIGGNGDTQNGVYDTRSDDGLPKQVSAITSVQTTFNWTGTCGSGFNAAYDVWFSASPPSARYNDAISGFVMVWLCDPNGASSPQPIGSKQATATIAGHTWDVWVGPRGGSGSNSGAPVVSYTAQTAFNSFTFDLNLFIKDALTHGIQSGWYLTDVFAGFEIWTGSTSSNIGITKFTAVVQ